MEEIWTYGTWTVTPGREDEFTAAWQDLADWNAREFLPGAAAVLLRDDDQPNVFVSFGGWPDTETIDRWRASAGMQTRVRAMMPMLESFVPHTAALAAGV